MSLPGAWMLHYSWGATSSYAQTTLTLKSDGTFSGEVDVRGTERHLGPDATGDDRRRRRGGSVAHPRCSRERPLARASSEGGFDGLPARPQALALLHPAAAHARVDRGSR